MTTSRAADWCPKLPKTSFQIIRIPTENGSQTKTLYTCILRTPCAPTNHANSPGYSRDIIYTLFDVNLYNIHHIDSPQRFTTEIHQKMISFLPQLCINNSMKYKRNINQIMVHVVNQWSLSCRHKLINLLVYIPADSLCT